jgi:uncharacterized protein YhbP (UPF0306 family)
MGGGRLLCQCRFHPLFSLCTDHPPQSQLGYAATIQEDYEDWPEIKGIQLEGKVYRVEGKERAAAITRYGVKFPVIGNLAQAPAQIVKAMSKIAWYKVIPERIYFIDNSLGLGHRDEVLL